AGARRGLPFVLVWKARTGPACIGLRFEVADSTHGLIGARSFVIPQEPAVTVWAPAIRSARRQLIEPLLREIRPPLRILIAAIVDDRQPLGIAHRTPRDPVSGQPYSMRLQLVVVRDDRVFAANPCIAAAKTCGGMLTPSGRAQRMPWAARITADL